MQLLRAGLAIASTLAAATAALEIHVATASFDDPQTARYCSQYLCDESAFVDYGYGQQIKGGAALPIAISVISDSLSRDPASAQRWIDLGQVLAASGQHSQANYCIERAIKLGGDSAAILLAAGDFNLQYGDKRQGLRDISRSLQLTSVLNSAAFSYFEGRGVPIEDALHYGIPHEKPQAQAFLRYLIQERSLSSVKKAWAWIVENKFVDRGILAAYTSFLFQKQQFQEAADAWRTPDTPGPRAQTEFIYNGDFAAEPLAATPFDWRLDPDDTVKIKRECDDQNPGCQLRIDFDGTTNIDFRNASQLVVLRPGTYHFRASVKAEGITTDQGPAFQLNDGESEARLKVSTPAFTGTSAWQTADLSFSVTAATRYVVLRVVRHPSLRFDSRISGSLLIKSVSITPAR